MVSWICRLWQQSRALDFTPCFSVWAGSHSTRNQKREIPFFWQVTRQVNSDLILTFIFELQQAKEAIKCSIYGFQGLLPHVGIQQLIVFISFAIMGVGFVFKVFTFGKGNIAEPCTAWRYKGSWWVCTTFSRDQTLVPLGSESDFSEWQTWCVCQDCCNYSRKLGG